MTWETFPNAPIVEAVLDLRASLPPDVSLERMQGLLSAADGYPHQEDLRQFTSNLQVSPEGVASNYAQSIVGSMYFSPDRSRIVQARLNGFTVNHLKPYATWSSLAEDARHRWPGYVKASRALEVTRVALRYVNHIHLPRDARLEDYLNLHLTLGEQLPDVFSHFNGQVGFQDPASDATVLISYGVQPRAGDDVPIVLDIDVFKEQGYDPGSSEIWATFEQLREVKNRVFFGAITEKAKGGFR